MFRFGPPSGGRLPLWVLVRDRSILLCELSDAYPFLTELREWMERCLAIDRLGDGKPGIVTLDTSHGTCSLVLIHAGWEKGHGGKPTAVSVFTAILSGERHPVFQCFCRTRQVVGAVYSALMRALDLYRELFDNRREWYDTEAFSARPTHRVSNRMKAALFSPIIEYKADFIEDMDD